MTHLHTPREGNHLGEMLTKANLSSQAQGQIPCQSTNIPRGDAALSASASPTVQLQSFPQKASTIGAAVSGSLETAVQVSPNIWGEWQNPFNTSLSQSGEGRSLLL